MHPQNTTLQRPALILAGKTLIDARELVYSFAREQLVNMQQNNQNLSTADFLDFLLDELQYTVIDCYKMHISTVFADVVNRHHIKELRACDRGDTPNLRSFIGAWLKDNQEDGPERRKNIIVVDMEYPTASQFNPNKLVVWRNTSKMLDIDKRQVVGVRKWIKSTLVGLSEQQVEDLARTIDESLAPPTELDVRHHTSYEFEAWKRAYTTNKIKSCMSPTSSSDVGLYHAYTCYCSGYHGLPDNGLKLTVLYQDDVPVARAITYSNNGRPYYIANYGDHRLLQWLHENEYEQSDFIEGTILYSDINKLKPYVDGDNIVRGDHCISEYGVYYWILSDHGEYWLDNPHAYLVTSDVECIICGKVSRSGSVPMDECITSDGKIYHTCDSCFEIYGFSSTTHKHYKTSKPNQ